MAEKIRLSTDPDDPKYRLRLSFEDGLFELADEALTSAVATAEVTKKQGHVWMTIDEARWQNKELSNMLARLPLARKSRRTGPVLDDREAMVSLTYYTTHGRVTLTGCVAKTELVQQVVQQLLDGNEKITGVKTPLPK